MTIKKRLAISNIIMIVVPVIITLIIGCVCIGAVYFTLYHTNGFGFEDSEDFYRLSQSISMAVDEALEGGKDDITDRLDVISKTLNAENTALIVSENGQTIYSFGIVPVPQHGHRCSIASSSMYISISFSVSSIFVAITSCNPSNFLIISCLDIFLPAFL